MSTPEEIEVARRNLLAELKAIGSRSRNNQGLYEINDRTLADLVEVLGAKDDRAEDTARTFDFGEHLGYEHRIGDAKCGEGWCSGGGAYPRACEEDRCTGLVHANFGDENYDGDYWLYTKCDVCGESE